uniref:Transmembrane protein n=1 Tax=Mesocestoides corti TaxID=53468 RepID=A0A5K3EJ68_MESCO
MYCGRNGVCFVGLVFALLMFRPTGEELFITLGYGLLGLAFLVPPDVLLSAGLTIENIFRRFLGSEELFFAHYHLRRTSLVKAVISFLPLGYFLTLRAFANPNAGLSNVVGNLGVAVTVVVTTIAWAYIYLVWYANGQWTGHPSMHAMKRIAESLLSSTPPVTSDELTFLRSHPSWQGVASSINKEFRQMEKFVAYSGRGLTSSWPGRRIVVTPSWILYSHRTTFLPICQLITRISAVVVETRSMTSQRASGGLSYGDDDESALRGSSTMATVRIVDVDAGACLLSFDLPAGDLENLRIYLQCPLVYAQGVSLEPSIIQKFLDAFFSVVKENEPISPPSHAEPDLCIGCMSSQANVILKRACDGGGCGVCRCRPMWCASCLGRWFASRMTQLRKPPSEWLASRVPCPTCRTLFCVRDVWPLKEAP